MDLELELERMRESDNREELEREFVLRAKAYAEAKGIARGAFRRMGVPARLLKEAGITS